MKEMKHRSTQSFMRLNMLYSYNFKDNLLNNLVSIDFTFIKHVILLFKINNLIEKYT